MKAVAVKPLAHLMVSALTTDLIVPDGYSDKPKSTQHERQEYAFGSPRYGVERYEVIAPAILGADRKSIPPVPKEPSFLEVI